VLEDLLNHIHLVLLFDEGNYPHLASALRTLERINLINLSRRALQPGSST
jgi:hypothetical protein